MKYFLLILVFFSTCILNAQIKVKKYTTTEIHFTQTKQDTLIIKSIDFNGREGGLKTYSSINGDTIFKKQVFTFNLANNNISEVLDNAKITYLDKNGVEQTQKIKLKIQSKCYNPYEESVQCQGTTQKGYQCSRSTRDKSGYCWQHGN